tara:strand:- start:411 stop:641 length:231 start_codon:yes stop_codon:yes gene_type:complete
MVYYYTLFITFIFLAYIIVTDPNAAPFFILQLKILYINIKRWLFILKMYPVIKYQNWKINQDLKKLKQRIKNNGKH